MTGKLPIAARWKGLGLACYAIVCGGTCLNAAVLSFESYQTGDINIGGQANSSLAFPDTNQDGWSNAAGSRGIIAPASANGLDGQFLTLPAPLTAGNNITMIAARVGAPEFTGTNTVGFDVRFSAGGTAVTTSIGNGVSFLNQLSGTGGTFNQNSDTGMFFGQLGNSGFGVRSSNFGTSRLLFSTTGGEGIVTTPSGALVAGNWYRVEVSITGLFEVNPGEMGRTVTMSVYDYANEVSWGSNSRNASDITGFGGFDPEESVGVIARVQRNNADNNLAGGLDNISVTVVPEPSTVMFAALGVAAFFFPRRKISSRTRAGRVSPEN